MAVQVVQRRTRDVIVLDVTMPDMNGYEVCQKLQEQKSTANIPVILATVLAGEDDKIRAFQAGAADYLVKPINEKALFQMVDLHLVTSKRWKDLTAPKAAERTAETKVEAAGGTRWDAKLRPSEFTRFKEYLGAKANRAPELRSLIGKIAAPDIYSVPAAAKIPERAVAEAMAQFL